MLILGLQLFQFLNLFATQDSLYTAYRHGLNNDLWRGGIDFQNQFPFRMQLFFSEIVSSSRLRVNPFNDQWKDQNQFLFGLRHQWNPNLSLSLAMSSYLFKDNQSGYISDFVDNQIEYANQIQTHFIKLGATVHHRIFHLPFKIGIKGDQRFKQFDRGLSYQIGMNVPRLDVNSYIFTFSGSMDSDDLNKRKNRTLAMNYLIHRQFYADTYDTLKLNLQNLRRDYYISQKGDIESRVENTQGAENTLSYRLNPHLICQFTGGLSSRILKINILTGENKGPKRERQDFNIRGGFHLMFKKKDLQSNISFILNSDEQTYKLAKTMISSYYSGSSQLITPDNQSRYSTFIFNTKWRFLPTDSLLFSSIVQRFQYNTPSLENIDDRDELRYRFNIQEHHRFSSTLSSSFSLNVHLHHLVYIYGEKSANNNWTRIFRINPALIWKPDPRYTFSHSTEVMANYVDYDYEALLPGVKSFLFRKLKMEDSIRVQITSKTSLYTFFRSELDENGKMLWTKWLEQKIVDRQSYTLNFHFNYKMDNFLQISPGYTFFHRKGYLYQETQDQGMIRKLNQNYKSHGPSMKITYQSQKLTFYITGSTIKTNSLHLKDQILTRIDMNMVWRL